MNRKKRGRRFPLIVLVIIIAGGIAAAAYIATGFNIDIHFSSKKTVSQSESILTGIRKIFMFSTVEYVYKSVFPFDFYDQTTQWDTLTAKRKTGGNLTAQERDALALYDLCSAAGIRLSGRNYQFLVITSLIKAGLSSPQTITADSITIDGKNITLRLPKPEITESIIEDTDSSTYDYPDMDIDPRHWKQIARYVQSHVEKKVLQKGILTEADSRLKEFISSFLHESGFQSVTFIQ